MEQAQKAEEAMWGFVSRVLRDPGRILVGMDALIERKRAEIRGNCRVTMVDPAGRSAWSNPIWH